MIEFYKSTKAGSPFDWDWKLQASSGSRLEPAAILTLHTILTATHSISSPMQVYYTLSVVLTLSQLLPHHLCERYAVPAASPSAVQKISHIHPVWKVITVTPNPCCAELGVFFCGAMRSETTHQILMYIFCIHIIIHSMWPGWLNYTLGKTRNSLNS